MYQRYECPADECRRRISYGGMPKANVLRTNAEGETPSEECRRRISFGGMPLASELIKTQERRLFV